METMVKTPTKYFLVKGAAEGMTELNSFDMALLDAGIGDTNLVKMSSIVPPASVEIEPIKLPGGALVPVAYAAISSEHKGDILSAAVAIGIPEDDTLSGLIMEHSAVGELEEVEEKVRQMVIEGFRYRNRKLKEIKSIGATIKVGDKPATAFAAIVLWY